MQPELFPTALWETWECMATFIAGDELPEESAGKLWAVLAFVFYGDKVVLADIRHRGMCIPSGKIEPGETLDEAIVREVWEETGAVLRDDRRRLLGCYCLEDAGPAKTKRYCPVFVTEASGFEPIPVGFESLGIFLAAMEDVADLYFFWDDLMAAVFAFAADKRDDWFPVGMSISEFTSETW